MKETLGARRVILFLLVLLAAEASAFDNSFPDPAVIVPVVFFCFFVFATLMCLCQYCVKKHQEERINQLNQSCIQHAQTMAYTSAFPYGPPPALREVQPFVHSPPVGIIGNAGQPGYQQSHYPPQGVLPPFQGNPYLQPVQPAGLLSESPPPKYEDCVPRAFPEPGPCYPATTIPVVQTEDGKHPPPR